MEYWGVEVNAKEQHNVTVHQGSIIHVSQATLGGIMNDTETVTVHVQVGEKKLVLGMLSQKSPELSVGMSFDEDFVISHNWNNGSIHLAGVSAETKVASEEEDEDHPVAKENAQIAVAAPKALARKPKEDNKVKAVAKDETEEEESFDDSDRSSDEQMATAENNSDDESDDDDSEESEEEEPNPKKAKIATPQKTVAFSEEVNEELPDAKENAAPKAHAGKPKEDKAKAIAKDEGEDSSDNHEDDSDDSDQSSDEQMANADSDSDDEENPVELAVSGKKRSADYAKKAKTVAIVENEEDDSSDDEEDDSDESFVLCGDSQGRVFLRTSDLGPIAQYLHAHSEINSMCLSRYQGTPLIYVATQASLFCLSVTNSKLMLQRNVIFPGVRSITNISNGRVATINATQMCVWSPRLERQLIHRNFEISPTSICSLSRQLICVGDVSGSVRIFNLDGDEVAQIPTPQSSSVSVLHAHEENLLIGHSDGALGVYSMHPNEDNVYRKISASGEAVIGGRIWEKESTDVRLRLCVSVGTSNGIHHMFFPRFSTDQDTPGVSCV